MTGAEMDELMRQMLQTTAGTAGTDTTIRREDVEAAIKKLASLPVQDKWILVDPQGGVYTGTAMQLFHHLARYHPLLAPLRPLNGG